MGVGEMKSEKPNVDKKQFDDVIRRMLSTPPQNPKPRKKAKKSDK